MIYILIQQIMIDITNKCNYNCLHCYKDTSTTEQFLPADVIISWCKFCKNTFGTNSVVLSGGETLLYPELEKLLSNLADYSIRLNTNGFLLNQYLPNLIQFSNVKIAISMDGYDDDTYFLVRDNHYYDRIIENIKMAKAASLNVMLQTVLTSATIENYEKFIGLSKQLNVKMVIRPIVYSGKESQRSLLIDINKLQKWLEEIEQKEYLEYVGGRSIRNSQSCRLLHKKKPSSLMITCDGNIYPCPTLENTSFLLGNIFRFDLEKFYNRCVDASINLAKIINCQSCQNCRFRTHFGDGSCISVCKYIKSNCFNDRINEIQGE